MPQFLVCLDPISSSGQTGPVKPFLESEYYSGALDEERQVIVLKRTPLPFKDPEAMLRSLDEVVKSATKEGAESWPLLADQVDAPDPTSERYRMMFLEMGKQMRQRFNYIAVLLQNQESVDQARATADVPDTVQFFADRDEAFEGLEKMRQG